MVLNMQWWESIVVWNERAGFQYADDICPMASSEEAMNVIMKKVNECVIEYGLKVKKKNSKVHKWT